MIQVATTNFGKIKEFRLGVRLWLERGGQGKQGTGRTPQWRVEPVPGIGSLPPCVEDGKTFAANAGKKAVHYSRLVPGLVVADDSGLEVDALNGAPGVLSRRFAGPRATDEDNNTRLLQFLAAVPAPKRTARFVCVLALARNGELLGQFRGLARGLILDSPRGKGGFGYDPLFLDFGSDRTFAELQPEEKFERSHRGQALRALLVWMEKNKE